MLSPDIEKSSLVFKVLSFRLLKKRKLDRVVARVMLQSCLSIEFNDNYVQMNVDSKNSCNTFVQYSKKTIFSFAFCYFVNILALIAKNGFILFHRKAV